MGKAVGALQDGDSYCLGTRIRRFRFRRLVTVVVVVVVLLSQFLPLNLFFGGDSYWLYVNTFESWPREFNSNEPTSQLSPVAPPITITAQGKKQAVIAVKETVEKMTSAVKEDKSTIVEERLKPKPPAEGTPVAPVAADKTVSTSGKDTSGGKDSKGDTELRPTTAPVKKSICPEVSPKLVGIVKINKDPPSLKELESAHPELKPGGHHKPKECVSMHKVAIIIPYRDRESHLLALLNHLHPILQRQQIDYTFFVVEQSGEGPLNRGMLKNVGVIEAIRRRRYTCLIFHDVDLMTENDLNPYTCLPLPRHLSVGVNTFNYRLPYDDLIGGVTAISVMQFLGVNGFSNKYWGWGAEDDDLTRRLRNHGLSIMRYSPILCRYTMLPHPKDPPNPERLKYLKDVEKTHLRDGLNSIRYRALIIELRRLYTWVFVELFPS